MNYAILLAGGTGNRITSDVPKQYIRSGKSMMLTYALKPLTDCDRIDAVCIVAESRWRESILSDAELAGMNVDGILGFAEPGANRQMSIMNGMKKIIRSVRETADIDSMNDTDTVLIHDAARPFLSETLLYACYEALPGYDGVLPSLPMKDTVYLSDDGKVVLPLLDRQRVFAGQAPELFYLKPYYKANMALMPDKILTINGASEPAILSGLTIKMIGGDENNYKITTDGDIKRFLEGVAPVNL